MTDEAARAKFEAAWGAPLPQGTGLSASQILAKAESGEIRGLYVVGENPLETYPDRAQVERALGKLEFLVVQDLFLDFHSKDGACGVACSLFCREDRDVYECGQTRSAPSPRV